MTARPWGLRRAHAGFPYGCGLLLLAAGILSVLAWLRGPEYDEQYTLFLTAGSPRPTWPDHPFPAAEAVALQASRWDPLGLARALRATDVHPPLYFWLAAAWRALFGDSLFVLRLASVACSLAALAFLARIAARIGVRPILAVLLTLGCYGFAYPGVVARGFAASQALLLGAVAVLIGAIFPRVPPSRRGGVGRVPVRGSGADELSCGLRRGGRDRLADAAPRRRTRHAAAGGGVAYHRRAARRRRPRPRPGLLVLPRPA